MKIISWYLAIGVGYAAIVLTASMLWDLLAKVTGGSSDYNQFKGDYESVAEAWVGRTISEAVLKAMLVVALWPVDIFVMPVEIIKRKMLRTNKGL